MGGWENSSRKERVMQKIECFDTGIIYKNPAPHVRSLHAYFPSLARFSDGELAVSFSLGQAFESADNRPFLYRSLDEGSSWAAVGAIPVEAEGRTTCAYCRLSVTRDDELVAAVMRYDRSRTEYGLCNEENLGFVETEFLISRSADRGRSWSKPKSMSPPLVGPSFELCCPVQILSDGRWLFPTSTWRGWDGTCPNGMKAVAFVSRDGGESWGEYLDVMADKESRVIYWESKIAELADGSLLAVAWTYDEKAAKDGPNSFALCEAGNKVFSEPKSTGLLGQTLTPIPLDDGRILSIYRRTDKQGLWANISRIENGLWINEDELHLWGTVQGSPENLISKQKNMVSNFNKLRFGAPSVVRLNDRDFFVAFWAVEDCVSVIRWFKIKMRK